MTQRDIAVQPGETPVTAALRTFAGLMGWVVTATAGGAHTNGTSGGGRRNRGKI